jgi:hypothetical protein
MQNFVDFVCLKKKKANYKHPKPLSLYPKSIKVYIDLLLLLLSPLSICENTILNIYKDRKYAIVLVVVCTMLY